MRICFVTKFPPTQGGVAVRASLLAEALAEAGHDVFVVTNAAEVGEAYRIWEPAFGVPHAPAFPTPDLSAAGGVTVVDVPAPDAGMRHIPQTDATVSRLAGAAAEVVRAFHCDVVYSNYLEPCGVAAHMAAQWTDTPHVVRTAGTDRHRLMNSGALHQAYKQVLRGADAVLTAPGALSGIGVGEAQHAGVIQSVVPLRYFHPDAAPLRLDRLVDEARRAGFDVGSHRGLDPARPVIGYYGKANSKSGLRHLVEASALLDDQSAPQVVALVGRTVDGELRARIGELGLTDRIWLLPFIPARQVPGYLRSCTAVALLEFQFPIRQHVPTKLRECFATGVPAIVTRELIDKDGSRDQAVDGENVYIVEDPRKARDLAETLRRVAAEPAVARQIGKSGQSLLSGETDLQQWADKYVGVFRAVARGEQKPAQPVTADSVRPLVPILAELLGADFDPAFQRFLAEAERSVAADVVLAASEFSQSAVRFGPRYAAGLHSFAWIAQAAVSWLWIDAEARSGVPCFPITGRRVVAGVCGDPDPLERLVRSNYLRIVHLPDRETLATQARLVRSGMPELSEVLARWSTLGAASSAHPPQPLLLLKSPNLDSRSLRISSVVEQILRRADGTRTAADVAAELGLPETAVQAAVDDLCGHGAVRRSAAPPLTPPVSLDLGPCDA